MENIETEGRSVEEAVESALQQLGRRREEVGIEILEKGWGGIFGLGAKPAKVRVTQKQGGVLPPDAIGRATDMLVRVVKAMGMDVEVEAKHYSDELYLEVDQGAGGILIGRHGTTLAALSCLMEIIVNQNENSRVKVFVDVAGYLERKRRSLVTEAQEKAVEVKKTGHEVEFGPMSAFERKVIHTTLHNNRDVRTFSRGEGGERRVVITPGGATEGGPQGEGGEGADRPGERGMGGGGNHGGRGPGGGDRQGREGDFGQGGRRRGRRGGRRRQGQGGGRDGGVDQSGLADPGPLEPGPEAG